MERRYKLAEAKAKFSEAVRAAKAGERVVLVERDQPILVLTPYSDTLGIENYLEQLATTGRATIATGSFSDFQPSKTTKPNGGLARFLKDRSRW